MNIGIDDLDEFESVNELTDPTDGGIQDNPTNEGENNQNQVNDNPNNDNQDFISALLQSKGIEDKSKIKFENEEGDVEEVDWDNLSNEDKLNILNSSTENTEPDLDDTEIQLINTIRESGLSPSEYLQYVQQEGITNYMQNYNSQQNQYTVDQYSDDELFIADFISRMGDVTEEEAQEALDKAKSNEALFKKQIGAIRNEYKTIEEENQKQLQIEQEQQAQEEYNEFANKIADQIGEFTELYGYDLNMEQDDMEQLFEFITGFDQAGNNYFSKALSDPKILVQTAWFALNGQQMLNDITEYFQKEITQVRKESYNKGLSDAKGKSKDKNTVYKPKTIESQSTVYSDLDEF